MKGIDGIHLAIFGRCNLLDQIQSTEHGRAELQTEAPVHQEAVHMLGSIYELAPFINGAAPFISSVENYNI